MRTWNTIDKSEWARGPWDDEPDKAQWTDEETGFPCLIVRQPDAGQLCGYVGVNPDHPWYEVGYSDCPGDTHEEGAPSYCEHSPVSICEVHGGITFSNGCQERDDPSQGICHIPEPGQPDKVWWFGFDCAHAWDVSPGMDARMRKLYPKDPGMVGRGMDSVYRTFNYVKREVERLARQLEAQVG